MVVEYIRAWMLLLCCMNTFFVLRFFLAQIEDQAVRAEWARDSEESFAPETRALSPADGIVDLSSRRGIREPRSPA